MRSLRHGTPLVCIPAKGGDQAPIGAMLDRWGAGRPLPGDASVDQIRFVVEQVLQESGYHDGARRRSAELRACDGAGRVADALEAVAAG
jgi:UDP:flavonoid glycosyltransferase YjiC (YdhE family)